MLAASKGAPSYKLLSSLLNRSSEWIQHSDQKHDLFITDNEKVDPFLVHDATERSFAGLLTNGPSPITNDVYDNNDKSYVASDIDNSGDTTNVKVSLGRTVKSKESEKNFLGIDDSSNENMNQQVDGTIKNSINPTQEIGEKANYNPFIDNHDNNNSKYENQRSNIETNNIDQIYKNHDKQMNDKNERNADNDERGAQRNAVQISRKNDNTRKNDKDQNSDSMRSDVNKAIQSSYKIFYSADNNTLDSHNVDNQPQPSSAPDRVSPQKHRYSMEHINQSPPPPSTSPPAPVRLHSPFPPPPTSSVTTPPRPLSVDRNSLNAINDTPTKSFSLFHSSLSEVPPFPSPSPSSSSHPPFNSPPSSSSQTSNFTYTYTSTVIKGDYGVGLDLGKASDGIQICTSV